MNIAAISDTRFCEQGQLEETLEDHAEIRMAGATVPRQDNGTNTDAFATTDGVKQDYALVPILFSLRLSTTLIDFQRDERPEINFV
nr:unnamed protein product [Spirometra erinaceieuropaei]